MKNSSLMAVFFILIDPHEQCLCEQLFHAQFASSTIGDFAGINRVYTEISERDFHVDNRPLLLVEFVECMRDSLRDRNGETFAFVIIAIPNIFFSELRIVNEENSGIHHTWLEL